MRCSVEKLSVNDNRNRVVGQITVDGSQPGKQFSLHRLMMTLDYLYNLPLNHNSHITDSRSRHLLEQRPLIRLPVPLP